MGKSVLIYHVEWFVRILIAAICGCCIGYERSSRNKGAGIRTHAILALGSALMVLISKYGFCDFKNIDGSRLAAQIVSGVGFLGAGVIFVRHGTVSGLTTAAGMWATSGVGMCIGCGLYDLGIISTFLIVGLQTLFHRGFFLRMTQNTIKVRLEVLYRKNLIYDIENLFSNISKYALENSRVYIDIIKKSNEVYIEMKNISKEKLNISAEELMQRFVRGDKSRTTEGSGLGISIAQNLTEIQKGVFNLKLDGDLFRVELIFNIL